MGSAAMACLWNIKCSPWCTKLCMYYWQDHLQKVCFKKSRLWMQLKPREIKAPPPVSSSGCPQSKKGWSFESTVLANVLGLVLFCFVWLAWLFLFLFNPPCWCSWLLATNGIWCFSSTLWPGISEGQNFLITQTLKKLNGSFTVMSLLYF